MPYQVEDQLITNNRSHEPLTPQGFVIHSTDTPGAIAQNEHDYFNAVYRGASAHYIVDWLKIIRLIPESEKAWHAGPTANGKFLSVEMCEPKGNDPAKFQEVWNRTVWLVADACVRYGWSTGPNVFSHRGISAMYHETNHTDPIDFLARYGNTWEQLIAAIDAEIQDIKNNKKEEEETVENAVLYYGPDDQVAARMVSEKYGNCAMYSRNLKPNGFNPDVMKTKHLIVVGGPAVNHPNVTNLSGNSWFDTVAAVGKFLG